jgi:DNA-binding MarR family transcriptional regulator
MRKRSTKVAKQRPDDAGWTFFSNHGHVLFCLAQDPDLTLREVSDRVGITERSVQRIVTDLEAAGYLTRIRDGARNRYEIERSLPLRHQVEQHRTIGDLIRLVLGRSSRRG